jgi:phosphohistidine swiveling domain-containing protein
MGPETRVVLPFAVITEADADWVGPKAFHLAQMHHWGLPVPEGFCITTAGYKDHVENIPGFQEMVAALADASAQPGALLAKIRKAIVDQPLSPCLWDSVRECCDRLRIMPMAVRSSATAEDLEDRSFAGQYETYLHVQDLEQCRDAVKGCWASLWSQRAYRYRQSTERPGNDMGMAVIVQQMVCAEAAGVMFTADPVAQDKSRLVIEACYGTGDAVVAGRVVPDRFVIDKLTHAVVQQSLSEPMRGDRAEKAGPAPADGAHAGCDPCIDEATIGKLFDLAATIEEYYQCPQDIEWAVCGSEVRILQSRAITTMRKEPSWEERQVWSCVNTREVMPDVLTPATWSLMSDLLESTLTMVLDMMGLDRGNSPVVGLVAGRCYGNLNTLLGILRKLPLVRHARLNTIFGDTAPGEEAQRWIELATQNRAEVRSHFGKALWKLPGNFFHALFFTEKKMQRALADLQRVVRDFDALDLKPLSAREILDRLTQSVEYLRQFISRARHGSISGGVAIAAFMLLRKVCVRWLGESESFANGLLIGVGDMTDARSGLDLWQLAEEAGRHPPVKSAILSGDTWEHVSQALRPVEESDQFLRGWTQFMRNHGHHARGEFELYNARWCERPDYILSLVRSFMSASEQTNVVTAWRERTEKRRQRVQECRARLKNPLKRAAFNRLLTRAQRFVTVRENSKDHLIRLFMMWRRLLVALGDRWHAQGVLRRPEDVFFLTLTEMRAVAAGAAEEDMQARIEQRKSEYEIYRDITPPITVLGRFTPQPRPPVREDATAEFLNGLAVCPGIVRGKARVIQNLEDESHVLPGEILVAPFTDPGWTPYLVCSSGIVIDQGGLLSHGSIIAREYGIPTVVNVGPATRLIKTGDTVEVNGDRGTVRILRR